MSYWEFFERSYDPQPWSDDVESMGVDRKRLRAARLARRRIKRENLIYSAYERLAALPNATDFVTRDIFQIFGISEGYRREYIKTHKVVGPGATLACDYAVIFRTAEELCEGMDFSVRRNGNIIIPLVSVLCYPSVLNTRLSPAEVLQLRRRAAVNPNSAAAEAQNYIRRRTGGQEVVVVGAMNRSVKECCKTIERFSEEIPGYDGPIESIVEGNWLQLFGPNGIRDWSISMPFIRAKTLKALYAAILHMGCDIVRLLFENEISILSAVLVDYGDKLTPPSRSWYSCAAVESCASTRGSSTARDCIQSAELLDIGERETMEFLDSALRPAFDSVKKNVVAVTSRRGFQFGNAVDIGGNCLVTCSHVLEAVEPGSIDCSNGKPDDLSLLGGDQVWEGLWTTRQPIIGELCCYIFVEKGEVRFSGPVALLHTRDEHVITSSNSSMIQGRSGAALVSLTDTALLGLFSASNGELLLSVGMRPEVKLQLYRKRNGLTQHADPLSRFNEQRFGLRTAWLEFMSSFIQVDGVPYFPSIFGFLNLSTKVAIEDRFEQVDIKKTKIGRSSFRKPSSVEKVVLVENLHDSFLMSKPIVFDFTNTEISDYNFHRSFGDRTMEIGSIGFLISVADCAILSIVQQYSMDELKSIVLPKPVVPRNIFEHARDKTFEEALGLENSLTLKQELLDCIISHIFFYSTHVEPDPLDTTVDEELIAETVNLFVKKTEVINNWLDLGFYVHIVGVETITDAFRRICSIPTSTISLSVHHKLLYMFLKCIKKKFPLQYEGFILHLNLMSELEPT